MNGVAKDSLRSRAEGSEASAFGMHQADAGSDAYDRDFALSLLSQEQDSLYEIDEALKRIEIGTYGICEMSGKSIPHARLEALPFTRYTVECQAELEKRNRFQRVRQPVISLFGLSDEEGAEEDEENGTDTQRNNSMPQEIVTLECTEAKAEGKPAFSLHDHAQQEEPAHAEPPRKEKIQSLSAAAHAAPGDQVAAMQPKTPKRRSAFRRANRSMPRRRTDIAEEAIDYKNPELLKRFVTESGKIVPRRVTGMSARLHRKITREIKRARAALLMK